MSDLPLERRVEAFAEDVTTRVITCLEGAPDHDELKIIGSPDQQRYKFLYQQTLHAASNGAKVGYLKLDYSLCLDRSGKHLAVHTSTFRLTDRRGKAALIRMEYVRDALSVPCSHVHVHAQSGHITHLLSKTGHDTPHAVESIHIPTGGDRFRPCVEDFVQFLVEECNVASREGWKAEVEAGREQWRKHQTAAAVRDRPEVAISVLEDLGLTVTGTASGDRPSARSRY